MMRFFEVDFTRRPKKPPQIITLSFSEVFFQQRFRLIVLVPKLHCLRSHQRNRRGRRSRSLMLVTSLLYSVTRTLVSHSYHLQQPKKSILLFCHTGLYLTFPNHSSHLKEGQIIEYLSKDIIESKYLGNNRCRHKFFVTFKTVWGLKSIDFNKNYLSIKGILKLLVKK